MNESVNESVQTQSQLQPLPSEHTHAGGGDVDSPLAQRRVVGQPEVFGDDAQDGVLVEPLAEAGPSGVLLGAEPHTSMSHLHFNRQLSRLFKVKVSCPAHADDDVHRAAVWLPVGVKGHDPDLDLLAGAIGGPVCLDEGGEALGVQVQLGLVGEHLSPAIVAVDLQYQRMPVGDVVHVDLQRWKQFDFDALRFPFDKQLQSHHKKSPTGGSSSSTVLPAKDKSNSSCVVLLKTLLSLAAGDQKVSPPATAVRFEDRVWFPLEMRAETRSVEEVRAEMDSGTGTIGRMD